MATNNSVLIDPYFYNFPDWVEIYNKGTTSLNLLNYYLSDDEGNLQKWKFPGFNLAARKYYLVYCDKENTDMHTNFGLATEGEIIYLSNSAGTIIDSFEYGKQYFDISCGRDPSNINQVLYCSTPTPNAANLVSPSVEISSKTQYSIPAGITNQGSSLILNGDSITYTTNGEIPGSNSSFYNNPITLLQTTVVKTKNFENGLLASEINANTYFINEHQFTLPVVSLSINPDYLNNNTYGIYVEGTNGIQQIGKCPGVANFNQDWERSAYLEYFDENGIKRISQPVGIKVSGGCTRFAAQKSLSVYARGKYGDSDFDYAFFKEKHAITSFKSFLLRNSGNDFNQTHLRDAFLQNCVNKSIDIDYQAHSPSIVYINGNYWGIMNIREKVDEDYFLANYGLMSDEIDFLEGNLMSVTDHYTAIRGTLTDFENIITFVTNYSLTNDYNYNYVASKLDLQEYLNYMAFQIYIANTDWPGNNLKFWKAKNNGKWRWIVFDTDFGFGATSSNHNTIQFATDVNYVDWPNPEWSTLLFRKLLENENFKKEFAKTLLTIRNTSFNPEWCSYVLDSLSAIIDFEMTYHKNKYGGTKNDWVNRINNLKNFATNRYNFIPGYVKSYFNLTAQEAIISLTNNHIDQGTVALNGAKVKYFPVNMTSFKDMSFSLEAIPEKGYKFSHWKESATPVKIFLIEEESNWYYLDMASDYPVDWKGLSFNDAGWSTGNAQLGYGDGDENTVISYGSNPNNKIPCALFRKKFTINNITNISGLKLGLLADDGAVVYLNGQEVMRNNMPTGTIDFSTFAPSAISNENAYVYADLDKSLLVSGENIFAVEVHQNNATSSDMSFALTLDYSEIQEASNDIYSYNSLIASDTSFSITLEPVFEKITKTEGIYLNELAPVSIISPDEHGESSGFIELYNSGDFNIKLEGFYLSDNINFLAKYSIPDSTIIVSKGFTLIYADEEPNEGPLHVPFKLDVDGESVILSQKVGDTIYILDSVSFPILYKNHSFGKYPDGTGIWQHMNIATPAAPNNPEVYVPENPPLNDVVTGIALFDNIKVFPNPSNGNLIISIIEKDNFINYSFDVIDISGKNVYPEIWLNSSVNRINLNHLNNGLYFLRIFNDQYLMDIQKLIIQK